MKFKPHLDALYRVNPPQGRDDYLRLDMNENPEGLPEAFVRNVLDGFSSGNLARYPEKVALTIELSDYLGVDPKSILFGNGSDDLIKSVYEVFGAPGTNVVSVYPTFEMYAVFAKMYDMEHKMLHYDSSTWSVRADDLIDLIDDRTAIVSVLNPNNPIGTVFTEDEVRRIIRRADEIGAVVVIDEAYHYFFDKTFLNLVAEYENVILLRTFSKLCSIAGLRIGFAVAAPEVAAYMGKVKTSYDVNNIAIEFARAIIRDKALIEALTSRERAGRAYIVQKLEASGHDYFAQNGNYVFIKCPEGVSPAEVSERMKEKGILIKTYSHPIFEGYFRITTGSKAVMEKFWNLYEQQFA
ncbi:MAG: histidinol-phosphate aminotransferase family protein [Clostridiales Family XIII bacterium]|jgi:histidinol-phosphate aminotransferase|nr:histidinol-phosphate aminotransferase family protein [Clostridiales Family XIII bacterium]